MALGVWEIGLVGAAVRHFVLIGLAATAVGFAGAILASRLFSRFLFGIQTLDATTYAIVATLIVCACAVASYASARRITRVNPVEVLTAV